MGDLNAYCQEATRVKGRNFAKFSVDCLKQLLIKPTQEPYILDLVFSEFASGMRCKVIPGIHSNDHDDVLITAQIKIPAAHPVERTVYDFKKADWRAAQALPS